MKFKKLLQLSATSMAIVTTGMLGSMGIAYAAYPDRPITLIVPWAAGGGTDATARVIGSLLEKELGKPVNIINRTGGNGVVGHQAIASAKPDGYTIGLITVEITMMHHMGLTKLGPNDFTPLALMNVDPAAITVSASSPYKSMDDLVKAIQANPGKLKASGTGQGGIWHVALAGMLKSLGVDHNAVNFVPSKGAAPAMLELVSGGIDIVPASLPEARAMIDADKARPLVVMAAEPSALYPKVPTLKSTTGSDWQLAVWRGIAAPKMMPPEVQVKLAAALKSVNESKDYRDFMAKLGYGVAYADGPGFGKTMQETDRSMGVTLRALGLSKE